MRSVAIALAVLVGGCSADTVLRIEIPAAGTSPAPVALRVTLVGSGISAAPLAVAPVSLPGIIVVKGVPDAAGVVCVEVEGLDGSGQVVDGGSTTVGVAAHRTTLVEVALGDRFSPCSALLGDMTTSGPTDLAGADLAPPDGGVAICPAGALFCDDFESGDTGKWTSKDVKKDAGMLDVQSATVAHGSFALGAVASGAPAPGDVDAELLETFAPTAPPFALRANVYLPASLGHFNLVIALEDANTNGFSIGGDDAFTWVVTEDQASVADHHTTTAITAGQWHCVELVVDAAGMVTFFVDQQALAGPWARNSATSYQSLLVGITRSVDPGLTAFIDDVALGRSRLYCPQ